MYAIRAAYFEVKGGDLWNKIVDLKITSYYTRQIQVYMKYGTASPYESTPCAWKLVAETSPSYYQGYKKVVYPTWVNGFTPVILPANELVSFYIVNLGTSYGILGGIHYNTNRYSPWMNLDAGSPAGAVALSSGRKGYNNAPFKPYPTYYKGYSIYGGIKMETMQAGSTQSPTPSPTVSSTPDIIETKITSSSADEFNGLQFDVKNLHADDVIINKFSVRFSSSGTKHVEVWYREGSHQGSSSGCDHWNNWCNNWTKLSSSNVYSLGSGSLTDIGTSFGIAKAKSTTSFAIISTKGRMLTQNATSDDVVDDGVLIAYLATPIEDYHGDNVQTIHAIAPANKLFPAIDYEIAHGICAIHNKASWVVLDPLSASSLESEEETFGPNDVPEPEEFAVYGPNLEYEQDE